MSHLALTPETNEATKVRLHRSARPLFFSFLAISLLPFVIYALYHFNVFGTKVVPPFEELEQTIGLVSTANGTGTAFLISESQLLTARHVVDGLEVGDQVNILLEKATPLVTTTATIEWKDDASYAPASAEYFETDAALLRLTNPEDVEHIIPLSLGDSDGVTNGTDIIVLGYPETDFSLSKGSINNTEYQGKNLLKFDAATTSGGSGGPLIDAVTFEVVGICVGERAGNPEGSNIANKINNIRQLLDDQGLLE